MKTYAPLPDVIGPYRVLRPIARGGMAEVYEVEDRVSGERFALKLLIQTGSALPRFNREYEALTRLNHPNIVRVYHYGVHDTSAWLTMEYLRGAALQARVKGLGKPGDPKRTAEVLRIIGYVADALHYIHQRGLIHRDLKSDNVVVLPDGRVKLLDFGTAHVHDPLEPITKDGEFVGTFSYASPEQLTGGVVDRRADLYSLGVLLYRLCTGQKLFDTNDPVQLARLHAKTLPRAPREIIPDLPKGLEDLICWLLQKRAEARPADAAAVVEAIHALSPEPDTHGLGIRESEDQAVGREALLLDVLARVGPGLLSSTVLVEGGAGSGRSRFVAAALVAARGRGIECEVFEIGDQEALPAFFGWLSGHAMPLADSPVADHRHAAEVITRQIETSDWEGTARRRDVVRHAARVILTEIGRRENKPLWLVIPDLDRSDLRFVEFLNGVRSSAKDASAPVHFLLCAGDVATERDLLVRQRLHDAVRVKLEPLSVRGVALTVGTLLNRRPPPSELARRIHQATGGQPDYVEESVRGLLEANQLALRGLDGNRLEWLSKDHAELPLAASARASTESRLRALPLFRRRILEAVAAIGEGGSRGWIARGLGLSDEAIAADVDALVDAGWLTLDEDADDRVGWTSALCRRVVDGGSDPARRLVLRRQFADARETERITPDVVRLLLSVERVEEAAALGVKVAGELNVRGSPSLAIELLDEVVRRLPALEGDRPERFADVYVSHARCLQLVRPSDPAVARSLARATELARTDEMRAQIGFLRSRFQLVIGHYPNYRKHLQEAWEYASKADIPRLSSTLAAHLAQSFMWTGQPRTAAEWFEHAREYAVEADNPVVMAYTEAAIAPFELARGEIAEAERTAASAMSRFRQADHPRGYWGALATWAHALREQGRFSLALSELNQALPVVRDAESPTHYVQLLVVTARCEVDLARLGRAQELVDELDASARQGEHLHIRLESMLLRGRILLASGQYRDSAAVLNDVLQRGRNAGLTSIAEIARALLGEAAWASGEKDQARELFRNACLGLMGNGDLTSLTEACTVRARAMAEEEDPAPLFRPVAALVESPTAALLRIEYLLARSRWLRAKNDAVGAFRACRDAATLLNQMASGLNDTDRAALRVHPWSKQIRHGLKAS